MSADAASDAILDRLTRLHPKAIDLSAAAFPEATWPA